MGWCFSIYDDLVAYAPPLDAADSEVNSDVKNFAHGTSCTGRVISSVSCSVVKNTESESTPTISPMQLKANEKESVVTSPIVNSK